MSDSHAPRRARRAKKAMTPPPAGSKAKGTASRKPRAINSGKGKGAASHGGNPYHNAEGHFTDRPHAVTPHGKPAESQDSAKARSPGPLRPRLTKVKAANGVKGSSPSHAEGKPSGAVAHSPAGHIRINHPHIFEGEVRQKKKNKKRAVGYHHRLGGVDPPTARVTAIVGPPDTRGVYRAEVEVFHAGTKSWIKKGDPSTFFPDSWSQGRVLSEIEGAFRNRVTTPGNSASYWEGHSPSGIRIGGYLDPAGGLDTAYPVDYGA
jgi:hypothetical protein